MFSGLVGWVFVLGIGNATLVLDELKSCICSHDNVGKKVASPKMHFLHILWEDKERPLSWTRRPTEEINVSCAPSLQRSWFSEANAPLSGGCSGFAEYTNTNTLWWICWIHKYQDISFFWHRIYKVSQERLLTKFWMQCWETRLLDYFGPNRLSLIVWVNSKKKSDHSGIRPKIWCPNIALKIRLATFSGHPAGTNTKADKLKPNVVAMTPMNTLAPTAFSMWGVLWRVRRLFETPRKIVSCEMQSQAGSACGWICS